MGVREGKRRQKGEGFPATPAVTATDWDPVGYLTGKLQFLFIPPDDVGALFGPIRIELVRRDRKWDKKNRSSSGLCPGVDLPQDLSRKRSPSS